MARAYGFSGGDVKRIGRSVHKTERDIVNRPQQRANTPASYLPLVPIIITQTVGEGEDELPIAIYREATRSAEDRRNSFECRRVNADFGELVVSVDGEAEGSLLCYTTAFAGVAYTDSIVWARPHNHRWEVVAGGAFNWLDSAATITATGESGGTVELWDGGPQVTAYPFIGIGTVAADSRVAVMFDDQAQKFFIIAVDCPGES